MSFEPQRHQVGTRCDDDVDMRHRERAVGAVELELAQSVAATEERSEDIPDVGGAGAPELQATRKR